MFIITINYLIMPNIERMMMMIIDCSFKNEFVYRLGRETYK
jgi:hypothetical protein